MAAPCKAGDGQAERQARMSKLRAAMAFLQEAMATGARPAAEVEAEAQAAGFTHATIQAARERLRIASKRKGNAWVWIPPKARKKQPVTR